MKFVCAMRSPGDRTLTTEVVQESVGILQTIRICREKSQPIIARYREAYRKKNDPLWLWGWAWPAALKTWAWARAIPTTAAVFLQSCPTGATRWRSPASIWGRAFAPPWCRLPPKCWTKAPAASKSSSGDTAQTLPHRQAVSERQTLDTGRAVYIAANQMREELAARPWRPGETRQTRCSHSAPRTYGIAGREQARRDKNPYQNYRGYAFLTQCVIVEVDRRTGRVRVLHVISANDVGRAINPQIIAGQVEGGIHGHRLRPVRGLFLHAGQAGSKAFGQLGLPLAGDAPKYDVVLVKLPISRSLRRQGLLRGRHRSRHTGSHERHP